MQHGNAAAECTMQLTHTHIPTAASAHHTVVLGIIIMHIIMLCVEIHTSSVLWNRICIHTHPGKTVAVSCTSITYKT